MTLRASSSFVLIAGLAAGCTDDTQISLNQLGAVDELTPATPARQIAVDAGSVYWLSWDIAPPPGWQGNESALLVATKANKDGTNPVAIAQLGYRYNVADNYALGIDSNSAYITDEEFIKSASFAGGGTPAMVTTSNDPINGVAVDDTNVYWTTSRFSDGGGTVRFAPKTGGTASDLATGMHFPAAVVTDATNVYWVANSAGIDAELMTVAKTGGTPTMLAKVDYLSKLVVDDINV